MLLSISRLLKRYRVAPLALIIALLSSLTPWDAFLLQDFTKDKQYINAHAQTSSSPFSDFIQSPLHLPSTLLLQQQNIIIGDTLAGKPTGRLRPNDHLQRNEFTKIAVILRLLEEGNQELLNQDLDSFTLKLDALLKNYNRQSDNPSISPFTDIEDRDPNCITNQTSCEPWYTPFINYASSKGMIKGYQNADGTSSFNPTNSMLRIHALKLVIASDGSIPANQDPKVIRITNDQRL